MTGVITAQACFAVAALGLVLIAILIDRRAARRRDARVTHCLCGHSRIAHGATADGTCPYPHCNCDRLTTTEE